MIVHNLGYPRIGAQRELKKLVESYWKDELELSALTEKASALRNKHWKTQKDAGMDLIPVNDFSFYDQVLDMAMTVGAIPERYHQLIDETQKEQYGYPVDAYFAMARGRQDEQFDLSPMEMTKWFDTNYHYIVPEFHADQSFEYYSTKVVDEFKEAHNNGMNAKPVLIGPVSFLLLGKETGDNFNRLDLMDDLLPVYEKILDELIEAGAGWIQLDEPFLNMDLDNESRQSYRKAYKELSRDDGKLLVATYFDSLRENATVARELPVDALHLDMVRGSDQWNQLDAFKDTDQMLSLGVVNGRNIWKNDLEDSMNKIEKAADKLGSERLMIAPSCSLLHVPHDLDQEDDEEALPGSIKRWMAFARQKLDELVLIRDHVENRATEEQQKRMSQHKEDLRARHESRLIHKDTVDERVQNISKKDARRDNPFEKRQSLQQENLDLPVLPTTTIGSFPQTKEVRKKRAQYKRGDINREAYHEFLQSQIEEAISFQEDIGLDLMVHGEFERNDMVEYFGQRLEGYAFTRNGWVQSYGSRCVKPPVIYGDVERPEPISVEWTSYASELTDKPVKGMLTGPITMLQWSFPRNDQSKSETALQLALAIRDEVADLEEGGAKAIQVDEPALREGLPLREEDWQEYLDWAVQAFRVATTVVEDQTQIHTHMCYAEFNDIMDAIADLDADVISLEASRSRMELLDVFKEFDYPNEIGPGVYDIHSPRVPSREEMETLIEKAIEVLNPQQVWVNPDCGLKTRGWTETKPALRNMVNAAENMREKIKVEA